MSEQCSCERATRARQRIKSTINWTIDKHTSRARGHSAAALAYKIRSLRPYKQIMSNLCRCLCVCVLCMYSICPWTAYWTVQQYKTIRRGEVSLCPCVRMTKSCRYVSVSWYVLSTARTCCLYYSHILCLHRTTCVVTCKRSVIAMRKESLARYEYERLHNVWYPFSE